MNSQDRNRRNKRNASHSREELASPLGNSGQFSRFALDGALLALLLPEPDHGYDLYQLFQEILGTIWRVGRSRLYAVLTALADKGLLSVTLEPQQDKPARKVFTLTETGRRQAEAWLRTPVSPPRRIRVELISKLALLDYLELPWTDELLSAQIATCEDALEWADRRYDENSSSSIERLTWSYRQAQLRATLDWLEESRNALRVGHGESRR